MLMLSLLSAQQRVGRSYGRVCRRRLRQHLLAQCAAAGVQYLEGEVASVNAEPESARATLTCRDGTAVRTR